MEDVERGTVKWFNSSKGYGFIIRPDGTEIFVHFSSIQNEGYKTLLKEQIVEFSIGDGLKGKQAQNVIVVK